MLRLKFSNSLSQYVAKMVSTRKKKNQQKRHFTQLNETLNDFIIGNNTNTGVSENEILEQQASGRHRYFERIVNNASQNQLRGNNTDDGIRDAVETAVIAVENRMQDAILTATKDVVFARVEMAIKSITGSSGDGHNSIVLNLGQRDFTANTENTPLRSASIWLDLKIDQDIIGETRDIEDSEDGDFPATRLIFDRRAQALHMVT